MKPEASGKAKKPSEETRPGKGTASTRRQQQDSETFEKYHVALSFAGEDRDYVAAVAAKLQQAGVRVFYDRFEETKLWGKNLYEYLSSIYRTRAFYTVIFVSRAYRDKLWTNVERRAAQAKAFSESKEYLLPAVFDADVEIPGVLKTTGYIDLNGLAPEDFAQKIILKLRDDGIILSETKTRSYGPDAKADVDFHLSGSRKIIAVIQGLKSHDWHVQRPAMEKVGSLDWADVSCDEAFVLGRNIYQCACGTERTAMAFLADLRRQLAKIPSGQAIDVLNGMLYEVYFDRKGEFRQDNLKSDRLGDLFAIQTVERYSESVAFIRLALSPYRESLVVMPSTRPEIVNVRFKVARKDPPMVRSIECAGQELLVDIATDAGHGPHKMWRLTLSQFSLDTLRRSLVEGWYVPQDQLKVEITPETAGDMRMTLPKGKTIIRPAPFGRADEEAISHRSSASS